MFPRRFIWLFASSICTYKFGFIFGTNGLLGFVLRFIFFSLSDVALVTAAIYWLLCFSANLCLITAFCSIGSIALVGAAIYRLFRYSTNLSLIIAFLAIICFLFFGFTVVTTLHDHK